MKIINIIGAALLLAAHTASHAQDYAVTGSLEPYNNLEDPVIITRSFSNTVYRVSLPFSVGIYGKNYSTAGTAGLLITPEGYVAKANSATGKGFVVSATMAHMGARDSSSSLAYKLTGLRGKQVLKIEWRNAKLIGNPDTDSMNVQLWLFEGSPDFEVHVGPRSVSSPIAYGGYEGPIVGVAETTTDFSAAYRSTFLSGYDTSTTIDTTFFLFPMSGTPREGMVYRFRYTGVASVEHATRDDAKELSFFPNPSGSHTMLALPSTIAGEEYELVMHDQLGREVRRLHALRQGEPIATDGMPAGIYHCTLTARGKRYRIAPLVVR